MNTPTVCSGETARTVHAAWPSVGTMASAMSTATALTAIGAATGGSLVASLPSSPWKQGSLVLLVFGTLVSILESPQHFGVAGSHSFCVKYD